MDKIVVVEDHPQYVDLMQDELEDCIRKAGMRHKVKVAFVTNRMDALDELPPGQIGLVSLNNHIPPDPDAVSDKEEGFHLIEDLRRRGYAGHVLLYSENADACARGRTLNIASKPVMVLYKADIKVARWAEICCKLIVRDIARYS